jgi:hypothetical protein
MKNFLKIYKASQDFAKILVEEEFITDTEHTRLIGELNQWAHEQKFKKSTTYNIKRGEKMNQHELFNETNKELLQLIEAIQIYVPGTERPEFMKLLNEIIKNVQELGNNNDR